MSSIQTVARRFYDKGMVNPVFMALILVGMFVKFALSGMVLSNDGTSGSASSLIWGYSLVIFSLIGIVVVNVQPGSNEWNDIKNLPWSLIGTIVVMIWIIGINIKYYVQINLKNVPDEYFMWSSYSSVLLLCLIGISVYQYALSSGGDTDKASGLTIYSNLIFVFNLIAVSIQQVVLSCFYVDG